MDQNFEQNEDVKNILDWQKNRNPNTFASLVIRYQPVVNQIVGKYKTTGLSPATLKTQATAQMIKAFDTYDPTKGAQPTTHIWNNLQKVQRIAAESLSSGHIPEHRNLKRATFMTVKENLKDRLGYDPSTADLADELGWDINEVSRTNSESFGEITASSLKQVELFGSDASTKDNIQMAEYLYYSVSGTDKVILEYTFGFGGKPKLNNKQIAEKLGVNEMVIHRAKKRLSKMMQEYK